MEKDYTKIHQAQVDFFHTGTTKNVDYRIRQLRKFKETLQANEDLLCEALYSDFRKSRFDVISNELLLVYSDIDTAIKKVKRWSKRKRVKTNLINFPAKSYIYPEPLGVSFILGAWNYPILLSLAPAVAAVAAGNTVVLKPSEIAWNTSNAIAKIINENFDSNFFTVLEGGAEEVTQLLELKWDKIFYTGGTNVGRIIYQAAAKHLTPVTLELGGKSPAFIGKDANLDVTVNRIVWGKFLNAGQTCVAPDYVLIDSSIKKSFLDKLESRLLEMNFSTENDDYVQIVNERHYDRLRNLIDEDKVFYQGEFDEANRIFPPVIMHDVSFDDKVMEGEIFGPILPVISYDNLDEVVKKVKSLPKPLACYVFTKDTGMKNKILDEISFGGGGINETIMHLSNDNLPFGGVGTSGLGNYHGKFGFDAFSHFKSVLDKPTWFDPKMKYPPYSEKNLNMIRTMFKF